jgi:hypothetical protein
MAQHCLAPLMKTLITLILASASCVAQSASRSFDDEHAKGLQQNPQAVLLTISTADGRLTYHMHEMIRLTLRLSSKERRGYTYEAANGVNVAGTSDDLVVLAPEPSYVIHSRGRVRRGFVCCASERRYLTEKPSIATFSFAFSELQGLSPLPRPDFSTEIEIKPGKYRVFLQTPRVLRGSPKSSHESFHGRGMIVTSQNILTLNILPDGPEHGKKQ